MDPAREVVITGLGVVSPIGIGTDPFWTSLCEGRSGVQPIRSFDASPMPVAFGAELKGFDPKLYVKPRKALKVMCRELQTAYAAASLAVEQAGLTAGTITPDRTGVVFGGEMLYGDVHEFTELFASSLEDGEFSIARYGVEFPNRLYPLWMLKNLPNMAACHVAIAIDARGPNNSIVSGDASGLLAMVEAIQVMQRGAADVMVVGASGTRVGLTGWVYRGDLNLSHRGDDPAAASRPFDLDRDGMVNGEGAAALVLETRAHALARGARPLARVRGFSATMATRLDISGQSDAIQRALRSCFAMSQLDPAEVGHVNAHGLSTVESDQAEAEAIRAMLGDVPVTALKSLFGNIGPAGSLLELVGSVLALEHDLIPATRNYTTPDPRCPIQVIHGQPLASRPPVVLKLGFSARGQTAAVLLDRPHDDAS